MKKDRVDFYSDNSFQKKWCSFFFLTVIGFEQGSVNYMFLIRVKIHKIQIQYDGLTHSYVITYYDYLSIIIFFLSLWIFSHGWNNKRNLFHRTARHGLVLTKYLPQQHNGTIRLFLHVGMGLQCTLHSGRIRFLVSS